MVAIELGLLIISIVFTSVASFDKALKMTRRDQKGIVGILTKHLKKVLGKTEYGRLLIAIENDDIESVILSIKNHSSELEKQMYDDIELIKVGEM